MVAEDRDHNKMSSAQKRQIQRDKRPAWDNPDRTQGEEQRERERKYHQSRSRRDDRVDPNDPNYGRKSFTREREAARQDRCNGSEFISRSFSFFVVSSVRWPCQPWVYLVNTV